MNPLFFPPQPVPIAPTAPDCFLTPVSYAATSLRYASYGGAAIFRRPAAPESTALDPSDVEAIAFQIQLYELGLDDVEWIRRQVAFRGMEARERMRYELDGTERFFFDGVPSVRVLPVGGASKAVAKAPEQVQFGPREEKVRQEEEEEEEEVLVLMGRMGRMKVGNGVGFGVGAEREGRKEGRREGVGVAEGRRETVMGEGVVIGKEMMVGKEGEKGMGMGQRRRRRRGRNRGA